MTFRLQILDSPALPDSTRIQLKRLSLKIAIEYNVFPISLILGGVQCDHATQNDEGGFADVFCGTYRSEKVAVKRVRISNLSSETQKQNVQRVGTDITLHR